MQTCCGDVKHLPFTSLNTHYPLIHVQSDTLLSECFANKNHLSFPKPLVQWPWPRYYSDGEIYPGAELTSWTGFNIIAPHMEFLHLNSGRYFSMALSFQTPLGNWPWPRYYSDGEIYPGVELTMIMISLSGLESTVRPFDKLNMWPKVTGRTEWNKCALLLGKSFAAQGNCQSEFIISKGSGKLLVRLYKDAGIPAIGYSSNKFWNVGMALEIHQ